MGICWGTSASATAPTKDGWWNETNVGLGFSATPPQVPSGGLYVQNGFSGPAAISALTFDVPTGAAVGPLTLHVAGKAVITSPPIACPLTTAGRNYTPAQGGAWSDRPAYDCSHAKVSGTVSADQTSVTFDVGPLLSDGEVAVAVLAGGDADQIAFDPPGPSSMAVTGFATPAAPAGAAPAAPSGSAGFPTGSTGSPSGVAATVPPVALGVLPSPGVTPPATPAATPSGSGVRSSNPSAVREPRGGQATRSGSKTIGAILGVIGLVGLLVAYTEGYGLLGGRIRPLRRTAQ